MEIISTDTHCTFTPLSSIIDARVSERIFNKIINETKSISLNLSFVQDCSIEFIESLREYSSKKNLKIFNINSDVFAIFNFMEIDKHAELYVSEIDCDQNTRRLINRNFSVI